MAKLGTKKKSQDNDEAWISSFADMMCLLLGFFMILYSLSFIDDRQFYTMGKSIAAQFSNGSRNNKQQGGQVSAIDSQARAFKILASVMNLGDPIVAAEKIRSSFASAKSFEEAAGEISKNLETNGVTSEESRSRLLQKQELGSLTVSLPYHPSFDSKSSNLDRKTETILIELAKYLQKESGKYSLEIIGHTSHLESLNDPSPIRGNQLGFQRSQKIAEKIASLKISSLKITISSRGSADPLIPFLQDNQKNDRKFLKNRRVDVVVRRS